MIVVFQQVDLDTALAAAILGVSGADNLIHRHTGALDTELNNPGILCIEAGGSGQIHSNNFDHHNTTLPLPPACVQAFNDRGRPERFAALVEFAERADVGKHFQAVPFPAINHLISGIRIAIPDPVQQLVTCIGVLQRAVELRIDPYSKIPIFNEWKPFIDAKNVNVRKLEISAPRAELHSSGDIAVGYFETDAIGAAGLLYRLGAKVAIVHNPRHGNPPVRKYTIAGKGLRVSGLLRLLNALEPGWGGPAHGTIIGSPRAGSTLDPQQVKQIVFQAARCFVLEG